MISTPVRNVGPCTGGSDGAGAACPGGWLGAGGAACPVAGWPADACPTDGVAGAVCAAVGFLLLDIGEDALDELVAEAFDRLLDAPDVDDVVADADDHRSPHQR